MPAYIWRAKDREGNVVRGKADAADVMELSARLRRQGLVVLGIDPDNDLGQLVKARGGLLLRRKVKGAALAVFCRQFATMIEAGLPLLTALHVMARQTADPTLRTALAKAAKLVEDGDSFAPAMAATGVFPPLVIHMLAAGEVGGMLEQVLVRLANQIEKDEQLRQKIKSAMIYPTAVSIVAVAVVFFMMIFVAPRFVQIYADLGASLPLPTRILMAVSDFFVNQWYVMLGLAVVAGVGCWQFLRHPGGRLWWDTRKLKLPVFGPLMVKTAVARFARTLGGLLASGVSILKALVVVDRVVGNAAIGQALMGALEDVRGGGSLVPALAKSGLFPPMVLEMTLVGEETGQMEEMLTKLADFYEADVQRTAERLSAALEPMIVVGLGLTVGLIVISLMLPIFNLWEMLGQV
jgi:type IV pilus assembly protein PilC